MDIWISTRSAQGGSEASPRMITFRLTPSLRLTAGPGTMTSSQHVYEVRPRAMRVFATVTMTQRALLGGKGLG